MKHKSLNRKLNLNKKTIVDLGKDEMTSLKGGYDDPVEHITRVTCDGLGDCVRTYFNVCLPI
ncbi:MAG: rSAM-modified peptide [bacterium]|nr:rSAM-modified peptide [bacterium]